MILVHPMNACSLGNCMQKQPPFQLELGINWKGSYFGGKEKPSNTGTLYAAVRNDNSE